MSFKNLLKSTIKTYALTVGSGPYYLKTWTYGADVPAAVHHLSGNESVIDTGKNITADIRVLVESNTLSEGERIKYDSKMYEIVHIDNPMDRGHHVELMCKYLPDIDESGYSDS